MGTSSVGRLWFHHSPHLLLVILMGILIATPTRGEFLRNTASRNVWRRQLSPMNAAVVQRVLPNPASTNRRRQSPLADDPTASQSEPNPASGTLTRRKLPLPVESADDAAGDQLQPNTASRTIWRRQSSPVAPEVQPNPASIWRRQSPPVDDAAAAPLPNAPPPPPPPPTNAILPSASLAQTKFTVGGSARQTPRANNPGTCYKCTRTKTSTKCLEEAPPNPATIEEQCHSDAGDMKNVRCITFLMGMKGARDGKSKIKDDEKKMRRIDGRRCMHVNPPYGFTQPAADCALEHLNLKLEDNKCIKGTYRLDLLLLFDGCTGWQISDYILLYMFDHESLPKRGTPEYKDIEKHGIFYGEYGRVQYADLTICVCKGANCNMQTKLGNVAEASGAERKL